MLACACDRKAASLMGIHVDSMVTLSFAFSALVGALGGVILAPSRSPPTTWGSCSA